MVGVELSEQRHVVRLKGNVGVRVERGQQLFAAGGATQLQASSLEKWPGVRSLSLGGEERRRETSRTKSKPKSRGHSQVNNVF